jgi:hypothetical protein
MAWVQFPALQDFSILLSIQTNSGAPPSLLSIANCGVGGGVLKWQGFETDFIEYTVYTLQLVARYVFKT